MTPDGTTLNAGLVEQTIGPGGTAMAEGRLYVATRSETVSAGLQQTVTVPPAGLGSEPYGVRYQIWLTVPATDTYRLAVYADDGFILNGQGLTDTNTTTRGPTTTEAYRELTLLPNTIYNFGLTYLNYSAATTNTLQLLWRKGGGALEVVPRESIHARGRRDYYSFGGAVVAVKEGVISTAPRVLNYLHGDHLGSVSLTTNAAGQKVSEQRYAPYGEVRWRSGAGMPTDFTFTGQRAGPANYVGSLMDYNARFFSPALGRFISADTIVPGAGNPAAFNRYAYVLNSPLRYVDSTGHCPICVALFFIGLALTVSGDVSDRATPNAPPRGDPDKWWIGPSIMLAGAGGQAISAYVASQCIQGKCQLPLQAASSAVKLGPAVVDTAERVAAAASADGDPTNEVAAVASRARGLVGAPFERWVADKVGGVVGTPWKAFDVRIPGTNTVIQAKGGEGFWRQPAENIRNYLGNQAGIAVEKGLAYEFHSNVPIPDVWKLWMADRGIKFVEWLE